MKTPKRLLPLIEDGVIDSVIGQLMSGKEATVYTVQCGKEIRCAKVYKEAMKRSFKKSYSISRGAQSSQHASSTCYGERLQVWTQTTGRNVAEC